MRKTRQQSSTRPLVEGGIATLLGTLLLLASGSADATVSGVSATPNPFNPGAAQTTTISYTLSNSALTWLKIYDGSAVLKRKLVTPAFDAITTNKSSGANSDIWDGKNDAGTTLANGSYPYTIDNAFFVAHYSGVGSNPQDIAVDPSNPSILWQTNKTGPYVYKSTDGGTTWSGVAGTGASAKAYGIAIGGATGQIIYMTDDGQASLNKSTNGGASWAASGALPSGFVADVTTSADGTIVYVINYSTSAIYKSTNSGTSFTTCTATGLGTTGPRGIATDSTGTTVIVVGTGNNTVYKSTNSCANFSQLTAIGSGTAVGQVSGPNQVQIQADGKFWISEQGNSRVQQFDANGNSLMVYGDTTGGAGNYEFSVTTTYFGIGAYTTSGQSYLYAVDYGSSRVKKIGYDNWSSATSLTIGTAVATTAAGSATATAASSTTISVSMPYSNDSNSNNTYTVDYKLSASGTWSNWVTAAAHAATPYATTITGLTAGSTYDVRMTYNDADGVTGTNPQTVTSITLPVNSTAAGTATAAAASSTSISVSMPYTNDANGNNTYTVAYKLSSAGTWTTWVTAAAHVASPYATTITGLSQGQSYDVRATYNDADTVTGTNPQTISAIVLPAGASNLSALSATPNPFNPNTGGTTTLSYTLTSGALTWINIYNGGGVKQRDLVSPGTVFTATNKNSGANSDVWNGRNNAGTILADGQYPYHIDDAFFSAHIASPGSNPHDIAVDPSNTSIMWLLDKSTPYLFKSINGGSSWSGVSGSGADAKAYGIAISADGQKIYIADNGQSSLIKSTNGGSSWTTSATFPASVVSVNDVATSDDGLIVYALSTANKVYRSTNGGTSWTTCAASGLTALTPQGIATNANGTTVMVADSGNDDVYQSDDSCGFFFGYGFATGTARGQLSYPHHIAIQSNGNFWVSERDNHRIQQFDGSGNVLMTVGGSASGIGNYQFNSGAIRLGIGLAKIADQTSVVVADYNNGRIKVVGYDNWVSTTHLTIASAPPNAPTALSAVDTPADNGGSINLAWTVSSTAATTQQRIYRSTTSGSGYALLATITNNTTSSYTDTTAVTGTPYYYVIRSYNGAQESANSTQASATAIDNIVPVAPASLAAIAGNAEVYLSWTKSGSSDVTAQRIYRSTTSGSGYVLINTIANNTATTFTNTGITNGTTYYYVVRAFDGSQESANSNQASATPLASIVNPPTGLGAVAGDARVDLAWTVSTSASTTQQRIYRSTTSGSGYVLINTIANNTATTYADTTATNNTTYYYVVRAFNGVAESVNSNQVSATPSANAAPVASNGNLYPLKDTIATGVLVASDANSDPLTYSIVANGTLGTATITNASTGAFQYVPNAGVTGNDSFTFRANDGRANSNTATITVKISNAVAGATLAAGMNYWHMISIPTHLTQKNDFYSILVDDLGFAPTTYRWAGSTAGTWSGDYAQIPTATPGKGYWLVVNAPSSVIIDDQYNGENLIECNPTNFPGTQCVDVTLQPGANIIGDPYPVNKDLMNSAHVKVCNSTLSGGCTAAGNWVPFTTAVTNSWILNTIYRYNPATQIYSTKNIAGGAMAIAPWEGWWLRVETNDTIILRFYR